MTDYEEGWRAAWRTLANAAAYASAKPGVVRLIMHGDGTYLRIQALRAGMDFNRLVHIEELSSAVDADAAANLLAREINDVVDHLKTPAVPLREIGAAEALRWRDTRHILTGQIYSYADSPIGTYLVWPNGEWKRFDWGPRIKAASEGEAKAAAQADYDAARQRIGSRQGGEPHV